MLGCGKRANFNCYKGLGRMKIFIYTTMKINTNSLREVSFEKTSLVGLESCHKLLSK